MRKYLLQILGISALKDPNYSLQIESFCLIISRIIRILLSSENYFFSRETQAKIQTGIHTLCSLELWY